MSDFYLEHKDQLKGQPKRIIGDYVETNGILVPKRFNSLKEAINSGLEIICRSEHEQEYNGVSGLLDSPHLLGNKLLGYKDLKVTENERDLINTVIKYYEKFSNEELKQDTRLQAYCGMLNLDIEQVKQESSFSFWQKINGAVRFIIADSSLKGVYHIFTKGKFNKKNIRNYTKYENGKAYSNISRVYNTQLPDELNVKKIVKIYEEVRNLSNFNPNHCPIMEFVSDRNKDYFLQYHTTRDFKTHDFILNRDLNENEIKTNWIRGCTNKEGIDYRVTIMYGNELNRHSKWKLLENEEASFDSYTN